MDEAVSAADANRNFSRILREVRDGHSYIVTAHGKPIAKIIPIGKSNERDDVRATAREVLFARLGSKTAIDIGPWTREELYEDSE